MATVCGRRIHARLGRVILVLRCAQARVGGEASHVGLVRPAARTHVKQASQLLPHAHRDAKGRGAVRVAARRRRQG